MNKQIYLMSALILFAGCQHNHKKTVFLNKIEKEYAILEKKYDPIINSLNNEKELLKNVRSFGMDHEFNFWTNLSFRLTGGFDIANSEGCPLHRTMYQWYFDVTKKINIHLRNLEKRNLTNLPIYEKFVNLRSNLRQAKNVVKVSKEYVRESQFLQRFKLINFCHRMI